MTAKEWLWQYRDISRERKELETRVSEIRAEAERITRPIKKVQTKSAGNGKTRDGVYAAILATEEGLREKICTLYTLEREIEGVIGSVEEARLRRILFLRYIQGHKWEHIANKLCYDYYYVVKVLHPRALCAVEEILRAK